MNPRAKRKPVVIRVSLGAREAHITLGLYRRAPLVSIIFLLLFVEEDKGTSFSFVPRYYCYDHRFHPPLSLSPSPALYFSVSLSLFFSLSSSSVHMPPFFPRVARFCVGVRERS